MSAGVLCAAAMLSTAGLVLSEKMDVLQLTFYTAPVSCAMLFPFYLLREVGLPWCLRRFLLTWVHRF